jgi:putative PEP-CTERM system histidine kinase
MTLSIGTLSYAAAAAAYCFVSALLLTSWRGRLPGALLTLASVITALWAGTMAYQAALPGAWKLPAELLEIGHKTAWLVFLLVLLGYARQAARPTDAGLRKVAISIFGACIAIMALTIALRIPADSSTMREWRFLTSILAPGLLALTGMLLVEHLYRNTNPQQRWSLKFLCLGLGAYFAFDFYLFSDAMLFRRVSPEIWSARGIVAALIAPFIAVSAARNPTWSLDVSVSRQFVLHSTTLLAAAAYLLVMATAGYYIRFFGGTWGGLLQVTFLFGAGVLLVLMLFSGTLRARFKIFLSKHFFSYRYDYREEWLRFTTRLSRTEPGARVQERCVEALAQLVESPGGALWIRQENGVFERVAQWNFPATEGSEIEGSSLLRFFEKRQWVVDLDDYKRNAELYEGLDLPAWLSGSSAWLIVPLSMHDEVAGFAVLARSRGRVTVNWEISDLLKTAGCQAATYVAQAQAAEALARSKQFESFNKMSAFVVHDLKNLVAQLSLLLRNAQRHKHNPEFQEDMLGTIESSVNKMNRILMQLRSGGLPVERPVPVRLGEVVARAVASKSAYRPSPRLDIAPEDVWVTANAERLERVVGHLVQNALEATPADGTVDVRVHRQGSDATIEVRDTGNGMTEEFIRETLFKPFESTKRMGMGIGTFESREYIRELGGRMEVSSQTGQGTSFLIVLPVTERLRALDETTLREGVG